MDNKEIYDSILLMLGAPIVKIELDESQIDYAIKVAEEIIEDRRNKSYRKNVSIEEYSTILKDLSLAKAKNILGRIRSKHIPLPSGMMDGASLIAESNYDMEIIEERLAVVFPVVPKLDEDPIFLTALASVTVELPEDGWNDDIQTDEEIAERVVKYAKAVAIIAREETK